MKQTMDNLTTSASQYLLQQGTSPHHLHHSYLSVCVCVCVLFADVLEYYLQNQILNSPSQFIEQYIKPTHVTLDSGI